MYDPALGPTRQMRAFGESMKNMNNNTQARNNRVGQYAAPKPTYGTYLVSEQAQDVLNRKLNGRAR